MGLCITFHIGEGTERGCVSLCPPNILGKILYTVPPPPPPPSCNARPEDFFSVAYTCAFNVRIPPYSFIALDSNL